MFLSSFLLFDCFSYFLGTFLVGLARAIWAIKRPETVFPVDRLVNVSQRCPGLGLSVYGGGGGKEVSFKEMKNNFHFRIALAAVGGVLTVARLLCGPQASLPEEDGGAPEGVLIGAPAAPRVEGEEEDEAPSNPPTGGGFSNEDPPPYVRKNTFKPYSHIRNVK